MPYRPVPICLEPSSFIIQIPPFFSQAQLLYSLPGVLESSLDHLFKSEPGIELRLEPQSTLVYGSKPCIFKPPLFCIPLDIFEPLVNDFEKEFRIVVDE